MAKRTVAGPLTGETHLPQTTFHLPLSSLSSLPSTQTYSASPSSPSAASTARRTPSTPAFTRTKPAPVPALRLPTPGRPVWGALRGSLCQTSARSSRFSYLPCPRPRFPRFTSTTSPLTQLTSASPAPLRRNLFAAALLFYPADGLPTLHSGPSPPGRASLRCTPSRSRTHCLLAACLPPRPALPPHCEHASTSPGLSHKYT